MKSLYFSLLICLGLTWPLRGAPTISGMTPSSGSPGETITITGTGFDTELDYTARIGTQIQTVQSVNGTSLSFQVVSGTEGGGVSIQEEDGQIQETGFYFEVKRSVVFSARLPLPLDPADYTFIGPGFVELGGVADGSAMGQAPLSRSTLVGVVGGENDPALFAIAPPSGAAVEISSLSHAVATVFMAPGIVPRDAGTDVAQTLDEIASVPEVRALASYVESVCVPGFDFIETDAYADRVEEALIGYLESLPVAQSAAQQVNLSAREEKTEQPVMVKNLIDPSVVDPVSLRVTVDPPGGKHPNHYLMKVDHVAPVVKVDFSIELTKVNPNSFPQGRQAILSANRETQYDYLDPAPYLNGYKVASLFSSAINVVEFLVVNGPESFPGLQAGFNDLIGLTPELEELVSPNNFLIPKDFIGVLAVHSYSGNLWFGTNLGFAESDPRSQIGLLNRYDRFNRWELAVGTNVAASIVDLASFIIDADDLSKGAGGESGIVQEIVNLVINDITKEGANVNSGADFQRIIFAIVKKYQEELFEDLLKKSITTASKVFGKKAAQNASLTLKAFAAISSIGQAAERVFEGLIGPKHYAMERALVVFNDPFEPKIRSFLPREGRTGDYISISGNNFSTTQGQAKAYFCTLPTTVVSGESPQPVKLLEAPVQVGYDTFIGIDVPANWDSVFDESDTVYLCVENALGTSTTTFSNEDPNRTFTYVGPPQLAAVRADPYPGSLLTVTGSRFHQERQGPLIVLLDGDPVNNGIIMNSSENVITLQLPANIDPGSHTLQLQIGELSSNLLNFTVRSFTGENVGSLEGLEVTVTKLDFNNVADGEISLGEALLILSGPGLGRDVTQRPEDPEPPAGSRFESDHLSGEGLGPVFANTLTIANDLETQGVVLSMPASFAPLLAAQAGDSFDAGFLTLDMGGAAFPGFDYSGVAAGRLRHFTLRNFSGPGITLRDGSMGLLIEGVGLEGLTGDGLTISSGAHDNTITNLRIKDASGHGVYVTGEGTECNRIRFGFGTGLPVGAPEGRIENCGGYGVLVEDGAQFNHIQPGAVIGNTLGGIRIVGEDTDSNILGINSDIRFESVNVFNNGGHGVYLGTGVDSTLIRYVTSAGNAGDGFRLEGPDCSFNRLQGIETVPAFAFLLEGGDLTKDDRNTGHGVHLLNGAHNNLLGEESSTIWGFGERSTITNNVKSGIVLDGSDTTDNRINHLNIGDAFLFDENSNPFTPVNGEHGIVLQNGANHNVVGDVNGLRDIHISSLPDGAGIWIDNAHFNEVFGCHIGTIHGNPLAPTSGIGPIKWGVVLRNGAHGNQIGYPGRDHFLVDATHIFGGFYNLPFNFIGFATEAGILLDGRIGTSGTATVADPPNIIVNNAIGFGQNDGEAPNRVGIRITGNTGGNVIGGSTPGLGNRIRGNEKYGVHYVNYELPLDQFDSGRNIFQWNVIEQTGQLTDVVSDPLNQLNSGIGVVIENCDGATFGESLNEPNTIRDNFQGVFIEGGGTILGNVGYNRIRGLVIDDINHAGIVVHDSKVAEVGGPQATQGNRITRTGTGGASDTAAIAVTDGQGNTVANNLIGSDDDSSPNLGNAGPGIFLENTRFNTVGGGFREHGNTILGNVGPGIVISGASATANNIQRNLVGIGRDLSTVLANEGGGVLFTSGAHDNLLGGKADVSVGGGVFTFSIPAGNTIRGNTGWGVTVDAGIGNQILNNIIDFNSTGPINLQNGGNRLIAAPEGVFDGTTVTGIVDDLVSTPPGSRVQVFSGFSAFDASRLLGENTVNPDGSFIVFTGSPVFDPVVTLTITSSADDSTSALRLTRFPIVMDDARSLEISSGTFSAPSGNVLDSDSGSQPVMALRANARNLTAFIDQINLSVSGSLFDDRDVSALGVVTLWHDRNGNGRLEGEDLSLHSYSPSGSSLSLDFLPDLDLDANEIAQLIVTIDLPAESPVGRTVAVSLEDKSDVVARLGAGLVQTVPVSGIYPISGQIFSTAEVGVIGLYLRSFPEGATASPEELDLLADPDGDGIPNALEYALGTDPFHANESAAFRLLPDNGHAIIEYTYPLDRTDISFRVAAAYDLANLNAGPPLLEEILRVEDVDAGTVTVTLRTTSPIPQGLPFFGRLHVE
ncbi:MAG: IPT/TIG domain-containing protein [Luteolibacter sp.]